MQKRKLLQFKTLQFNISKRRAKPFILGMLSKVGSAMVELFIAFWSAIFQGPTLEKKVLMWLWCSKQPSKSSGRKFVFSSIKNKMTHCLLKCFWQNFHTSSHDDCYARSSYLFIYFHLAWIVLGIRIKIILLEITVHVVYHVLYQSLFFLSKLLALHAWKLLKVS